MAVRRKRTEQSTRRRRPAARATARRRPRGPMSALLRARARETRGLRSEDSSAQVRRGAAGVAGCTAEDERVRHPAIPGSGARAARPRGPGRRGRQPGEPKSEPTLLRSFDPLLFPQFANLAGKVFHEAVTPDRVVELADPRAQPTNPA